MIGDLDEAAATAKAAGDTRTSAQIRADEFFHRLTHGAHGAPATPPEQPEHPDAGRDDSDADADVGQDDSDDGRDDSDGRDASGDDSSGGPGSGDDSSTGSDSGARACAGCGCHGAAASSAAAAEERAGPRRRRPAMQVSLTMTLGTWLALRDDPALLGRDDTLPGAVARALALDAARDRPDTVTWRCVIVDGEHGTVLGVGRPLSTPRHDPPARLADLVRAIHPTCPFPGCTVPARRCDLDHRHPYEHGGPTCSCNLIPLCRTHHRLKGSGLVTVHPATPPNPHAPSPNVDRDEGADEPDMDDELDAFLRDLDRRRPEPDLPMGSLVWQLRSGKTYLRVPDPATPAPIAPSMHDIPAHLHTQRRSERAELRRLNADLADDHRRDSEQHAAAQRAAEHAVHQAALREEQIWAPADDHGDRQTATSPAVPVDLAQLWADAPLPDDPHQGEAAAAPGRADEGRLDA